LGIFTAKHSKNTAKRQITRYELMAMAVTLWALRFA